MRQEKRAQIFFFFGPETARWGWGSSMRRGGGREVRAFPRKFVFRREESALKTFSALIKEIDAFPLISEDFPSNWC